jgi:hypothetical protein
MGELSKQLRVRAPTTSLYEHGAIGRMRVLHFAAGPAPDGASFGPEYYRRMTGARVSPPRFENTWSLRQARPLMGRQE